MSTTPMPPPSPEDGWRSSGVAADTAQPAQGEAVVVERTTTGPPPDEQDDGRRVWLWVLLGLLLIGLLAWFLTRGGDEESVDLQGAADTGSELTADQDGIGDDPADTPEEPSGQDAAEVEDAAQAPVADEPGAPQEPAGGEAAPDPAAEAPAAQEPAPEAPAGQDPAAEQPAAQDPAAEEAPAQATAQDAGSVTTADGRELFPIDDARLAEFAGADLTGQQVLVQSVVPGQGFWIGTDETNRIFVHPDAGVPLGFEPAEGQRINFDGFLKPNPADGSADVHDIPPEHGAEQHRQQGHHIQLRSATPAG